MSYFENITYYSLDMIIVKVYGFGLQWLDISQYVSDPKLFQHNKSLNTLC